MLAGRLDLPQASCAQGHSMCAGCQPLQCLVSNQMRPQVRFYNGDHKAMITIKVRTPITVCCDGISLCCRPAAALPLLFGRAAWLPHAAAACTWLGKPGAGAAVACSRQARSPHRPPAPRACAAPIASLRLPCSLSIPAAAGQAGASGRHRAGARGGGAGGSGGGPPVPAGAVRHTCAVAAAGLGAGGCAQRAVLAGWKHPQLCCTWAALAPLLQQAPAVGFLPCALPLYRTPPSCSTWAPR